MKAIHNKVNIVPVIAKADTLTLKERERLKKRVSVAGLGAHYVGCGGGSVGAFKRCGICGLLVLSLHKERCRAFTVLSNSPWVKMLPATFGVAGEQTRRRVR